MQEGVEILLLVSCYLDQNKLRPDKPLGFYAELTTYPLRFQTSIQIFILNEVQQTQCELPCPFWKSFSVAEQAVGPKGSAVSLTPLPPPLKYAWRADDCHACRQVSTS